MGGMKRDFEVECRIGEGNGLSFRNGKFNFMKWLSKRAVEVHRSRWILLGIKNTLSGAIAIVMFMQLYRQIDLKTDEVGKQFHLIGCLICRAVSEFMRSIGGDHDQGGIAVVCFHNGGKEVAHSSS